MKAKKVPLPKKSVIVPLVKRYLPSQPVSGKGITVTHLMERLRFVGIEDYSVSTDVSSFSYFPFCVPELNAEVMKNIRDVRILRSVSMANRSLHEITLTYPMIWESQITRWCGKKISLGKDRDLRQTYWSLLAIPRIDCSRTDYRPLAKFLLGEDIARDNPLPGMTDWISRYGSVEFLKAYCKKYPTQNNFCNLVGVLGRSQEHFELALKLIQKKLHWSSAMYFLNYALHNRYYDEFDQYFRLCKDLDTARTIFWSIISEYPQTPETLDHLFGTVYEERTFSPIGDQVFYFSRSLSNLETPEELYTNYVYFVTKLGVVVSPWVHMRQMSLPLIKFVEERDLGLETILGRAWELVKYDKFEEYDYIIASLTDYSSQLLKWLSSSKNKEWRDRAIDLALKIPVLRVRTHILQYFLKEKYLDSIKDLRARLPTLVDAKAKKTKESLVRRIKEWGSLLRTLNSKKSFPSYLSEKDRRDPYLYFLNFKKYNEVSSHSSKGNLPWLKEFFIQLQDHSLQPLRFAPGLIVSLLYLNFVK